MANAKRASMREGPLAALFRKTEEADDLAGSPQAAQPHESVAHAPEATTSMPADAASHGAGTGAESAQPVHPRQSGLPHPALSASAPAVEAEAAIPTPQERLRQAFSSEIPESFMERPSPHPSFADMDRPAARPSMADIAHEQSLAASAPRVIGQPIIRVVGVGGAVWSRQRLPASSSWP
jgi:cell division protein FtsZ